MHANLAGFSLGDELNNVHAVRDATKNSIAGVVFTIIQAAVIIEVDEKLGGGRMWG